LINCNSVDLQRYLKERKLNMILEGFDHNEFLRTYWQRKPLLIRHTGEPFVDPIDADELAGLACEETIESRIVSRHSDDTWHLSHGPFKAETFPELGNKNWTLLVQAVDQADPDVALLKSYFDFLPGWRIDDVMVSYACTGGGVGPHFDQYDVFLIQGQGSRRWQIGDRCNHSTALREDTELRLLQEFTMEREVVLELGDILYLPPRFAHHGISLDESLCYSIGFRAPSFAELLQGYGDELVDSLSEDERFEDPLAPGYPRDGAISIEAIKAAFSKISEVTNQKQHFIDFFGKFVTEPRYPERIHEAASSIAPGELAEIASKAPQLTVYHKNPSSRFAYFNDQDQLVLFVDGERFHCRAEQLLLVQRLCSIAWPQPLELEDLLNGKSDQELITSLATQGSLLLEPATHE